MSSKDVLFVLCVSFVLCLALLCVKTCKDKNTEKVTCEKKGGVYIGLYVNSNLCFKPEALIDVEGE